MTTDLTKWLGYRFESSSGLTSAFSKFAKDFKKAITERLPKNARLTAWSRGHFYVSGFIERHGRYVFFSVSDVRFWPDGWNSNILIRTAKSQSDFTGGSNHYATLASFGEVVERLFDGKKEELVIFRRYMSRYTKGG